MSLNSLEANHAVGCGLGGVMAPPRGAHRFRMGALFLKILIGSSALSFCPFTENAALAENLLLNSSFKASTNNATPDDWDLLHAAALEFKDLYNQYSLDDSQAGPVAAARVLKITNSEREFFHLYLLSRVPDRRLPAGDYVFSVYVKADRIGNSVTLSPSYDHMDLGTMQRVTTEWKRYSAVYHVDDSDHVPLSPMLVLPSFGTYWISAPQLESGDAATAYSPSHEDLELGVRSPAQDRAATAAVAATAVALAVDPPSVPSARFEFSVYTNELIARLNIRAGAGRAFSGMIDCSRRSGELQSLPFKSSITLADGEQRVVEIPIAAVGPGEYSCELNGGGRNAMARLIHLAPRSPVVRINQWRNTIDIDKFGYQIRGVMVGGVVPAAWYFADIVGHGINTIFYYPRTWPDGRFNTRELDNMLKLADQFGVKIIIGPMVMGRKDATWAPILDRYADLVRNYRNNSSIIAWFVFDEAVASKPEDLMDLYTRFKVLDPYRLVFGNWGAGDVPTAIGAEPPGTLGSTDVYSTDHYPFANNHNGLEEDYALTTIRALRTGALAARPSHSWLQLYGSLDVSREPTGDELNFMAYVNLLFGGSYSYFTVRSTAKATWDRVREIDSEISKLMGLLWFDQQATEVTPPSIVGHYLYSAWKTSSGSFLLVLHDTDRTEPFAIELKQIFGSRITRASTYFQKSPRTLVEGVLHDSFGAYATQVYEIN